MIVAATGNLSGEWGMVRLGTLLATVRDGRYSPNMCSPETTSAAEAAD